MTEINGVDTSLFQYPYAFQAVKLNGRETIHRVIAALKMMAKTYKKATES